MTVENESGNSLRDTLSAQLESMESAEPAEVAAPVESAPAEAAEPVSAEDAPTLAETPAEKAQRARDDAGRFAKEAAKKAAQVVKPTPKPAVVAPKPQTPAADGARPAVAAPALKAPQSWKPQAREKWAALPPEIQQEIDRRERDMKTGVDESASDRKYAGSIREAVAPFQAMLGGADPAPVVRSLFQTAHTLAYGPAPHKAQVVAHLIKSYGIGVEDLAAALDGQPAPQGQPQAQQQFRDPRVDQMLAQQQAEAQRRQQATMQSAKTELEKFREAHEFFEDVRETMADLHEVKTRRGLRPNTQELYDEACQLHPDVREALKQREAASQANATQASTQRARAASSSVKSHPASAPATGGPKSLRDQLAANWESTSR